MLGNIRFIGELGKLGLVREQILHTCIKKLLERQPGSSIDDLSEDLECLCQIMKTIGRRLDTDKARKWMDRYFERMEQYMGNLALPSRIRFSLQDVIELRKSKWEPQRRMLKENGPKTILQVREDAAKEMGWTPPSHSTFNQGLSMFPPPGDLFHHPHHHLNGMGGGGGMLDMFLSHSGATPLMGGVGTGPGVIPMDNFRPNINPLWGRGRGYIKDKGNMNKFGKEHYQNHRPGYRMPGGNTNRSDEDGGDSDHSSGSIGEFPNRQPYAMNRGMPYGNHFNNRVFAGKDEDGLKGDGMYPTPRYDGYPNVTGPKNNGSSFNRQNSNPQLQQKDIDKLPPRFRKKLEQQQGVVEPGLTGFSSMGGLGPIVQTPLVPPVPPRTPSPTAPPTSKIEEINLRPIRIPSLRPNIPSMLPRSAQGPAVSMFNMTEDTPLITLGKGPGPIIIHAPPNVAIKTISTEKLGKEKKKHTEEDIVEQVKMLLESFFCHKDINMTVTAILNLKPSKMILPRLVKTIIVLSMETCDEGREKAVELIQALKTEGVLEDHHFIEGYTGVLDELKELEARISLLKSSMAHLAAVALSYGLVTLRALGKPMEAGRHYPLILLILQSVLKREGPEWLGEALRCSHLELETMLPEYDRRRMMEILEDRGLAFLFPLLRLQLELWRQIQADPNAGSLYRWLREHCQASTLSSPEFIHFLYTNILKYVTLESTLSETDSDNKEKAIVVKEKELLTNFKPILQKFVQESANLQLEALYAVQVFCHTQQFPKGMMLRMFANLYDLEVIEEDAFFKWKEHISDTYPGKGQALFQVNQWLQWLEEADSESSDEE